MRAVRRIAKVIAINLLICAALLLPIELVFGDWFSGRGDISMLNINPNSVSLKASPLYPSGRPITYRRNAYGFRGPEEDPARYDMVVLGGSTTNERLLDEDDTWTVRLQALLRRRGCPLSIANSGVDGYTTVAHIASFEQWFNRIPGFKPRFVLAYIGVNDAQLEATSARMVVIGRRKSWIERINEYVAAKSAVHRLYAQLHGWWRAREAGLLHGEVLIHGDEAWVPATLPPGYDAELEAIAAPYRTRLERLTALIRNFGALPIYVTQHRFDGRFVDGAWQQVEGTEGAIPTARLRALDQVTLDVCRKSGVPCIDLADELNFEPGDSYDAMHTTPAGSERIAEFLAGALTPIVCRPGGDQSGSKTPR
jgi:lysophospholipase L1-like esterase